MVGSRRRNHGRHNKLSQPSGVWLAVCEALEVHNHSFRIPRKPVIDSAECLEVFITVMWEFTDITHFWVRQLVVNMNIVE